MHPKLADAARALSPAEATFRSGPAAFRPHAETLLGTGPGIAALLSTRLDGLGTERRALVIGLVEALASQPASDPSDVVAAWATKVAALKE